MLHRIKRYRKSLLFIFLLMVFSSFAQFAQAQKSDKNIFISFFQEHISPVDGDRCAMYPSCSAYASGAVKKHGILGWVMACDRLVRCGRDECKISSSIIIDNEEYTYDPVHANDFWWFDNLAKEK